MRADELDPTFVDPNADVVQKRQLHNSRKTKITLESLNKLKKMRAAKDLQQLMRGDFMEIIYGSASEEAGAAGGMGGGI